MNDSGDPVNLVSLPDRNSAQAAADEFRRNLPVMVQTAQTIAKLRRASYLAHIEEGFTPEQALHLCTL